MRTTSNQWYQEHGGYFGKRYLQEYADDISRKNTELQIKFLRHYGGVIPGHHILDVACGHGRHSIKLAKLGCTVTGVDINGMFLEMADSVARRSRLKIRWLNQGMSTLKFSAEFDVAISMFTSIGYAEDEAVDQQTLRCVHKALKRGGKMVIDIINREWLIRNFCHRDWIEYSNGSRLIVERTFDFSSSRNHERRVSIEANGETSEVQSSQRIYSLHELLTMCQRVGFKVVGSYGDFSGGRLSLDTKRCILIAQKE